MISGYFRNENQPTIPVTLQWGQALQVAPFLLDTGFTGDLKISPEIAQEMGLKPDAVSKMKVADGEDKIVKVAEIFAVMEKIRIPLSVIIAPGLDLAGVGFLKAFSFEATIDCKNQKVFLHRI